jgi:general stress protein 26
MHAAMPDDVPLENLPAFAQQVMKRAKFPFLATIDGNHPRVRPVSPVRVDGFTIFIANLRHYGKTRDIECNPLVELCYLDEHHDQVRITGVADVVTDRAILQQIWDTNPLLRKYLGTLDNPELIVYRVRPQRVRFMREWALDYIEVPIIDPKGSD